MKNYLIVCLISFVLLLVFGVWYIDILPVYLENTQTLDFNSFHNIVMTQGEVEEINNTSSTIDFLFMYIILAGIAFLFSSFNLIWLLFKKNRGDFDKKENFIEC